MNLTTIVEKMVSNGIYKRLEGEVMLYSSSEGIYKPVKEFVRDIPHYKQRDVIFGVETFGCPKDEKVKHAAVFNNGTWYDGKFGPNTPNANQLVKFEINYNPDAKKPTGLPEELDNKLVFQIVASALGLNSRNAFIHANGHNIVGDLLEALVPEAHTQRSLYENFDKRFELGDIQNKRLIIGRSDEVAPKEQKTRSLIDQTARRRERRWEGARNVSFIGVVYQESPEGLPSECIELEADDITFNFSKGALEWFVKKGVEEAGTRCYEPTQKTGGWLEQSKRAREVLANNTRVPMKLLLEIYEKETKRDGKRFKNELKNQMTKRGWECISSRVFPSQLKPEYNKGTVKYGVTNRNIFLKK